MVFLLDITEVPEVCQLLKTYFTLLLMYHNQSHTGKTLANVFHWMLITHGLNKKVCLVPHLLLITVNFLSFQHFFSRYLPGMVTMRHQMTSKMNTSMSFQTRLMKSTGFAASTT